MDTQNDFPIFLGICESVLVKGDGVLRDFYGVGELLILPFFPQSLDGAFLLMGFSKKMVECDKEIFIEIYCKKTPENKAQASVKLYTAHGDPTDTTVSISGFSKPYQAIQDTEGSEEAKSQMGARLLLPQRLNYKFLSVPCPPLLVTEPSEIEIMAEINGRKKNIGSFLCAFCQTPPISEEERIAIMSRPGAIKGATATINCKKCGDKVSFYSSLDRSQPPSNHLQNIIIVETAPDNWECKCGTIKMSLDYLKKGFHELFRRISLVDDKKRFNHFPLYQKGVINAILGQYEKLIMDFGNDEERVQKFLEDNPIFWNFLAPLKIWKKPPILTDKKADFAILTRMKVLYFVEIEKPHTKLIKAKGGIHSELQVGLDQIRDWRLEISKRRDAVLHGLKLEQMDVHDIRYILIAGMNSKTPRGGLEKIRGLKDADFIFCFDELASFLHSTETSLINI